MEALAVTLELEREDRWQDPDDTSDVRIGGRVVSHLGSKITALQVDQKWNAATWSSSARSRHLSETSMHFALAALAILSLSTAMPAFAADALITYGAPATMQYAAHNDDFTVQARSPGGQWQDLYEWNVRVDHDRPQDASMIYFDFTGKVELRIQKNNGTFSKVTVGPRENAAIPLVRDGKVYIILDRPQNFAVFFDDDRLHNLHVFAGAPIASPEGSTVRRFGPGLHVPPDDSGTFTVRSGETVYLEGGAVLKGTFRVENAENVRILGRGLIVPPTGGDGRQLVISKSGNVSVEGLIVTQPNAGVASIAMSKNIHFVDVKGISGGRWTDGINIYSSERVSLDRLFLRTSDDCVTVYAHRGENYGDSRDIRIANSTLWADVAHAMFVGIHGNSIAPEIIERVRFDNIDVVDVDEDDPDYEGVMSIIAGDSNLVRDITFSNIRIDRIEEAKLFQFRVAFNKKYNTSPGRGIQRVTLRNIAYTGNGMSSASLIGGYDASRGIDDVLLDNVTIGGRKLRLDDPAMLVVGPFATNIKVR